LSKAAQKRGRKELEKMLSSGRYWEWLEMLEKEALIDGYKKEWYEVWQTLARRAFREPLLLEEFLTHSESLKRRPDIPDIRFLLLLKRFIEGAHGGEELASFKGLGFPAEAIRKQAMTWGDESFPGQKLQEFLTTLIAKPEEATKKNYEEIALVLKGTPLSGIIKSLGTQMAATRSLGGRSGAKISLQKLSDIEFCLKEASNHIPSHLRQILFYPFLFQIQRVLQRLLETKQDTFAEIIPSIPYLLSMLVGEKAGSLRTQLKHQKQEVQLEYADFDRVILGADFDEKVALLGRMRSLRHDDEENGNANYFQRLYKSILSDIGRMRPSLSEREKKGLSRVMYSALTQDLPFLWNGLTGSEHDLTEILLHAAETGCLNLRLATLALVLSEKGGYRRLKVFAENFLKTLAPPVGEDILWVLDEFSEIVFPHVNSLRPLFSLGESKAPFANQIAKEIWSKAMTLLVLNSASKKVSGFFPLLAGDRLYDGIGREIQILRKELSRLKDCKELTNLADFLNCFPEDSFTEKGYQRLLNTIFEKGRRLDPVIEMVGDSLLRSPVAKGINELLMPLLGDGSKILESGFYDFLRGHWDGLRTTKLENLDRLIRILMRRETKSEDRNLLLRISNLLEERFRGGEKEAGALREKLMEELIMQKTESKLARPKRRRWPGRFW
jgi:hypothetical protein